MRSVAIRKIRPYLYLVPSLVFLAIFTYFPILYSLYLSFFKQNILHPQPVFAGLANYVDVFDEKLFFTVVKNTFFYAVTSIPVTMGLALVLAIFLNEKLGWVRNIYRVVAFYPTMIPMAAAGMLAVWLFNPGIGLVNFYLKKFFGVSTIEWLYDMKWALPAIVITSIWKNFGYFMLIYLAGLQNISGELYESADLEGCGFLQRLRYITLPLLRPTTMFVIIVGLISSFQVFDLVYTMTQGGPADSSNVIVYYIYQYAFRFWNIGHASALTVLFVSALLIFIVFLVRTVERRVHYEV